MTQNLTIGSVAPDFTLPDQDEKMISLADFRGKKLIIYFYPKDNTPGCTDQGCNLRDNYTLLQEKGFQIVGISADSIPSHKKFSQKYCFRFPLLADTEKTTLKSYGVWQQKKFMGKTHYGIVRTTFIINENGLIEHILTTIKTKDHAQQILNTLSS